jgi:hypothetical protein
MLFTLGWLSMCAWINAFLGLIVDHYRSLGIVFYEIFTRGVTPYEGWTNHRVVVRL